MIPLQDTRAQNLKIHDKLFAAFERVVNSGNFVSGSEVEKFELSFARFIGSKHSAGCSTGTSALRLALKSIGIKPGDKVIVPAMTFVATVEAVTSIGAIPVLVDVDEKTWNMDTAILSNRIDVDIKCVIPVHLHGRLAEMDKILELSSELNIPVIEDCAQAHGANRGGGRAGNLGIVGAFSFYPGKNLGALGEAGAITTSSEEVLRKFKLLRNWGSVKKYHHDFEGSNERMDELQAAFLDVKLEFLENWTNLRILQAKEYDYLLDSLGVIRPVTDTGTHVYHIYAVRVKNRDKILKHLTDKGISVSAHYPVPIQEQVAFLNKIEIFGSLNESKKLAQEFISLPLWEDISKQQIEDVVEELERAMLLHGK